jgi:hypothetical protein
MSNQLVDLGNNIGLLHYFKNVTRAKRDWGGTTKTRHDVSREKSIKGRTLTHRQDHNYTEPDSDDADMEEDPEEMQQVHLSTSTDRSRIWEGGDETIILNVKSLPYN